MSKSHYKRIKAVSPELITELRIVVLDEAIAAVNRVGDVRQEVIFKDYAINAIEQLKND